MKGWDAPSRQRREAKLEALSTDGVSFLSTKRKYKTLVSTNSFFCNILRKIKDQTFFFSGVVVVLL